jgi:hypothetical protein
MRAFGFAVMSFLLAGCVTAGNEAGNPGEGAGAQARTLHVEAFVDPEEIDPGQTVQLKARLVNGAGTPFRFQHCSFGDFLDDRGEAWSIEVRSPTGHMNLAFYAENACPADANATLREIEPGGVVTVAKEWGRYDSGEAPPGLYTFKASFHGLSANATFTLSGGHGAGAPVLTLSPDRTVLLPGESILLHANASNPTQRVFRFWDDYCGGTVDIQVLTVDGRAVVHRPYEGSPCMAPIVAANLAPGDWEETWFRWDGKQYTGATAGEDPGVRVAGDYVLSARFSYTDLDGQAHQLQQGLNVTIEG